MNLAPMIVEWDDNLPKEVEDAKKVYQAARAQQRTITTLEGALIEHFHPRLLGFRIEGPSLASNQFAARFFIGLGEEDDVARERDLEAVKREEGDELGDAGAQQRALDAAEAGLLDEVGLTGAEGCGERAGAGQVSDVVVAVRCDGGGRAGGGDSDGGEAGERVVRVLLGLRRSGAVQDLAVLVVSVVDALDCFGAQAGVDAR